MNFKTQRRVLYKPVVGACVKRERESERKKASYPGHNSISFSPRVECAAPGRNPKLGPIKEVLKGVMFPVSPSPPSLAIHCLIYKLATHKCIDLPFSTDKIIWSNEVTPWLLPWWQMLVTPSLLCLPAYPWHFHCLLSFPAHLADSDQGW